MMQILPNSTLNIVPECRSGKGWRCIFEIKVGDDFIDSNFLCMRKESDLTSKEFCSSVGYGG